MSCLWLCLSLLYTATFLQSRATSGAGVSLKCNETVEVVAGKTVTLNCTINCAKCSLTQQCKGIRYSWNNNTRGDIPCNSGLKEYNCEWDSVTYVSLTISNVVKEDNYTVHILTECGVAKSSAIRVQVIPGEPFESTTYGTAGVIASLYGIFVILIVLAILYFLFGTERCRKIRKLGYQEGKDTRDHSDMDTASWTKDPLTV